MFRITIVKLPGRKPQTGPASGVSHITTRRRAGSPACRAHSGGSDFAPRGRSARVKATLTRVIAKL